MGDVSHPLQGAVPEADHFHGLETATPGVGPGCLCFGFFKEGKERAHVRASANPAGEDSSHCKYTPLTSLGETAFTLRFWAHPHTLPLSKRLEAGCGRGSDFFLGEFYITISYCTEIILTNESWMQGERSSQDIKKKLQDNHEFLRSPFSHRSLQSGPWWGRPSLHRLTARISTCNPLLLGKVYDLAISQWTSLSK